MPITNRYIHIGGDDMYVRVFYDTTFLPGDGQDYLDAPLIDNDNPEFGPLGYCLLVVNVTGERGDASVYQPDGTPIVDHVRVPIGNPVTNGQARSRTAAQVASGLGWAIRRDVGMISFE